jgi:5-methylcytosine-specific restriction endonuclease McrA
VPYKDPEKRRAYCVEYNASHREEHRAYAVARYAANREREHDRKKAWREDNPEKMRAYAKTWRTENLEKARASEKKWRKENPEKERARCVAYRSAHLQEERERRAVWRRSHPVERAIANAKRRAIKLAATVGDPKAISAIYRQARENKKVRCYLCGQFIPVGQRHVDHIVPLAKGGKHTASNLAIACVSCNTSKGAKMPADVGVLL